MKNNKRSK